MYTSKCISLRYIVIIQLYVRAQLGQVRNFMGQVGPGFFYSGRVTISFCVLSGQRIHSIVVASDWVKIFTYLICLGRARSSRVRSRPDPTLLYIIDHLDSNIFKIEIPKKSSCCCCKVFAAVVVLQRAVIADNIHCNVFRGASL